MLLAGSIFNSLVKLVPAARANPNLVRTHEGLLQLYHYHVFMSMLVEECESVGGTHVLHCITVDVW